MKINSINILLITICCFCFQSCSGPNPNPGERTADLAWYNGKYDEALKIIKEKADKGMPWAQLRMGVAYQLGIGAKQEFESALKWYKKVAIQKKDGGWANGKMIGYLGKSGYFNQNSDAMIAQYQISLIYLNSNKKYEDIIKAYLWANYVFTESKGKNIFYCCEFMGGRSVMQSQIKETLSEIDKKITKDQRNKAEDILRTWTPSAEFN